MPKFPSSTLGQRALKNNNDQANGARKKAPCRPASVAQDPTFQGQPPAFSGYSEPPVDSMQLPQTPALRPGFNRAPGSPLTAFPGPIALHGPTVLAPPPAPTGSFNRAPGTALSQATSQPVTAQEVSPSVSPVRVFNRAPFSHRARSAPSAPPEAFDLDSLGVVFPRATITVPSAHDPAVAAPIPGQFGAIGHPTPQR